MALSSIPFSLPAEFLARINAGELIRYGAILKDVKTGRIVAHLQETGLLERLISSAAGFDPTGISGLVGVVQNAQISRKLSALQETVGLMQSLQLVNLASSVAGIGVTAASTAVILHRLDAVDRSLGTIEGKIDSLPSKWRELELRKTLVELKTTLERIDSSSHRGDAELVVKAAEEKLHYAFDKIYDGINVIVLEGQIDPHLLRCLLAGLSLCGSAQIKTLYWMNELTDAAAQSRRQFSKFESLALKMPQDILASRLLQGGDQAADIAKDCSEIRLRIAGQPSLTERLIELDVNGREYLEQVEAEDKLPLLLLPASKT